MIKYKQPQKWIHYDPHAVSNALVNAKATVISLSAIPYQKRWVDSLQKMELKREVAGTSRIEGADFTEGELDDALQESPEELITRSQKQAHAALKAYRWITKVPDEQPIDEKLITDIHRLVVTGADDDHCPPGMIRSKDQNVNFGTPKHRGAEGGEPCFTAFSLLVKAINQEFLEHDPLVQAIAAHFHIASMHPFLDGNGRTARCLEALMLQRANLRDTCFIAMSNYYYEEKNNYLAALAQTRAENFDLTSFLVFGLKGIEVQSKRLLSQISKEVSKELFMSMGYTLFKRLHSKKKRVLAKRQLNVLQVLLEEPLTLDEVEGRTLVFYGKLASPYQALIRDLNNLIGLKAISAEKIDKGYKLNVNLDWPTKITETEFFKNIKDLPKGKDYSFLR
jgi:Fic family protein